MRKPIIAAVAVVSLIATGCGAGKVTSAPPAPADQTATAPAPTPAPAPSPSTPAPTPAPTPEPAKPAHRTIPSPLRGIVLTGWYAGSPDLLGPLLDWAKSAGINTVVLDLKAEDGKVSWISNVALAKEIGANTRKVGDLTKLIQQLHDAGFWVAGRIVTMNDPYLHQARPAWAIPYPGTGYAFMDPKNQNVWQYNLDIADEAVADGVDEIQFDYIRYPEKLVSGYNKDTTADYRTSNIVGFLKAAVADLKPKGVTVSADVFGLTTSVAEGDDMQIGQDYRKIAEVVDYICPMVYPSHYANGTYGIADPDAHPYETVKESMTKALARTPGIPVEKNRPWIQDFTYPASGYMHYGQAEVLAQIKALNELGIKSFLLWDPSDKFTRGLDYSKVDP